jgi:hypothetical protein
MEQVETFEQMQKRFDECENLIKSIRGTNINQHLAKQIRKLSIGGFMISESRLDDEHTIVSMQRVIKNNPFGTDVSFFIVEGNLDKELNMLIN